jgi:hypothetical protein
MMPACAAVPIDSIATSDSVSVSTFKRGIHRQRVSVGSMTNLNTGIGPGKIVDRYNNQPVWKIDQTHAPVHRDDAPARIPPA